MLVVAPGTLSALIKHSYEKKTLVHWRLVIATALMSAVYILQVIWLSHERKDHGYNVFDWNECLMFNIVSWLWPLCTIPTLLYTWHLYDMVERAVKPDGVRYSFWPRSGLVAIAAISNLVTTLLFGLYNALFNWYFEPGTHHDMELAKHYALTKNHIVVYMFWSTSLCCVSSAGLLGGTIYWVQRMTKSDSTIGLKADALNFRMVIGHIVLLLS